MPSSKPAKAPPPSSRSTDPVRGGKRVVAPTGMAGLSVRCLRDQHGDMHFRFSQADAIAVVRDSIVGDVASLGAALVRGGILALTPAARSYAQRLAQAVDPSDVGCCYIATQPGPQAGVFVFPDGRVFGRCEAGELAVELEAPVTLGTAGSLRGWQDTVHRFTPGQPYLVFALSLAFTGMILDLLPYEGAVLIEIDGATSLGKTTLLRLASSAWGAPGGAGSIAASWRLSSVGLQHMMFARASAFLPLDEVNTAGVNAGRQAEAVGDAAFALERGENRVHDRDRTLRHARVCCLSTANVPISGLLASVDARTREAAEVRFITVPADAGAGMGIWSQLPAGFASPGEASDALAAALVADHGHAAGRFAHRLVGRRCRDEGRLRALLQAYVDQFFEHLELDPGDGAARRRATKFATIYAAGQLAARMGVLPLEEIGPSILAVYRRAEQLRTAGVAVRPSALERARRYLASRRADMVDLDARGALRLSEAALDAHPGFLRTVKGRRSLLLRGAAFRRLFGADELAAKRELLAAGALIPAAAETFQNQLPVRQGEEKTRVYCIALD